MTKNDFYTPKIANLSDDLMYKMNAKRLLSVYKNVRSHLRNHFWMEDNELEWFKNRLAHIKSILNTKEHVVRK